MANGYSMTVTVFVPLPEGVEPPTESEAAQVAKIYEKVLNDIVQAAYEGEFDDPERLLERAKQEQEFFNLAIQNLE